MKHQKIYHKLWLCDVDVRGRLIKNARETQINDNHQLKIKKQKKKTKNHDAYETESVIRGGSRW